MRLPRAPYGSPVAARRAAARQNFTKCCMGCVSRAPQQKGVIFGTKIVHFWHPKMRRFWTIFIKDLAIFSRKCCILFRESVACAFCEQERMQRFNFCGQKSMQRIATAARRRRRRRRAAVATARISKKNSPCNARGNANEKYRLLARSARAGLLHSARNLASKLASKFT